MRRAIAFLSGPWAHICDENKGFTDSRNFFVLRPLVLRVVSFESVYSALSDDVWYCSGWYWKFLRNIDLKSRHVKCVRSAWPECGLLRQLYNVCVYGAGSLRQLFNVCALWSYNLSRVFSFPRQENLFDFEFIFILTEISYEPKVSLILKEHFSCGNLPKKLLAHVNILGLKRPIHITCEWLKTMRSRRLVTVQRNGSR